MSIFSKLFHTRDKPQNYYTGTDMHYLFGRSSSGKQVNEFTAMQTTAVYACVRILASSRTRRKSVTPGMPSIGGVPMPIRWLCWKKA